ncbi:MAG: outer membrane protein assembly factor BamD [Bacteroidaceae bacterium]|nr:outer membrane protein assembly factor BamD [Bacteroidaceae bacterium]
MKKTSSFLFALCLTLLTGCGEFNAAIKHGDAEYKYEVAKACYVKGQYSHAQDLFSSLLVAMKGSGLADECLYMMAMSAYMSGDLETAAASFKKYYQTYPRGLYVEEARYYAGLSLYDNVPDPRLDQSVTSHAIDELQSFLDSYPYTRLKSQAQEMIQKLQDHLVEKEQRSAQLYYDLGNYFMNCSSGGSNYEACIVTSENALRDFPYALPERREQFMILILRSRYHLARQSVEEKRLERFRQAVDEYYGFANEFPESNYLKEAQTYLIKSQKALKGQSIEEE